MHRSGRYAASLLLICLSFAVSCAQATEETRPFQPGRFGEAELTYINDLPVLSVSGTPEEIGRQKAALTGQVARKLSDYPRLLLERAGRKERLTKYIQMSRDLTPQIPADHRAELRAFAEKSGLDRQLGILGNTMPDIYRGYACSSLVVDAAHSATKGPLFGRNLDFYTLNILDRYSLVTVHRPKGKHAFVSIGFPGLFGCLTGMNDAGLALAVHEVFLARDGATIFNAKGVPYTFCFRRMLEECSTVEEAEKLLRDSERTTILSLVLCDKNHSVALEMTPKTVVARHGSDGVLACTNHFRSDELSVWPASRLCTRYPKLVQTRKSDELGVSDLAKKLDEVNLGRLTVQTMVFEPAALKLHLAIGSCPSSALPLKPLDLTPLFSK